MRYLLLTFPTRPTESGSFVSLACANGVHLCYTVRKTMLGTWQLTIWEMDRPRTEERPYHFPSERKAKDHARADFRRRQIVRLVA